MIQQIQNLENDNVNGKYLILHIKCLRKYNSVPIMLLCNNTFK